MDNNEKRKRLQERIAKAEEKAQKGRDRIKELREKLKAIDKEKTKLTKNQETTIKILHGVACMHLMKEWPELASKVNTYLDKNINKKSQRLLLGLTVQVDEPKQESSENPVYARERIDLVVPYPDPPEARQRAKAAGAKWDGKTWYVEKGFDLTLVEEFLPQTLDLRTYGII